MTLTGRGRCAGACGELIQGFLSDGTPVHVSCPIDRYSNVEVRLTPADETRFIGFDESSEKMRLACARVLALATFGSFDVAFTHCSNLQSAKGLASSTADIVAMARAVAAALDFAIGADVLAGLAALIERSDGVMYDGVNAVDHVTGARLHRFDWHPDYAILMCIPPDRFVTSAADLAQERRSKPPVDDLLGALRDACDRKDSRLFSEACTQSAWRNQAYRLNPLLPRLSAHIATLGAQGLCVAHTGTVLGLLFAGPDAVEAAGAAAPAVRRLVSDTVALEIARLNSALP